MRKNCKSTLSAATATLLASGSSQAAIIYSGPINQTVNPGIGAPNGSLNFDLNGDLTNDYTVTYLTTSANKPQVLANSGSSLVRTQDDTGLPVTPAGTVIDLAYLAANPSGFFEATRVGGNNFGTTVGDWGGGATGFVGLQLTNGQDNNFGWGRFTYVDNDNNTSTLTLVDFAFETSANQGITTGAIPEVSTLGMLVLGAAGVAARRRRQKGA